MRVEAFRVSLGLPVSIIWSLFYLTMDCDLFVLMAAKLVIILLMAGNLLRKLAGKFFLIQLQRIRVLSQLLC